MIDKITVLMIVALIFFIAVLIFVGSHDYVMDKKCEEISNEAEAFEYYITSTWSWDELCVLKFCELDNGKFFCYEEEILMESG